MAGASQSSPTISIANEESWRLFREIGNEMILTKDGRNVFPKLQYGISGLIPRKKYIVALTFEQVDRKKYKYKGGAWCHSECCDPETCIGYTTHPDGCKSGEYWMNYGLLFDRVKISNTSEKQGQSIRLQTMRKYRPVVAVFAAEDSSMLSAGNQVAKFSSSLQEFIAVTAYQSPEITKLKIRLNPYARGFRDRTNILKRPSPNKEAVPSSDFKKSAQICGTPIRHPIMSYNSDQLPQNSGTPAAYFPYQYPSSVPYQYPTQPPMFCQIPGTASPGYPQMPSFQPWSPPSPWGYAFQSPTENPYTFQVYRNGPTSP